MNSELKVQGLDGFSDARQGPRLTVTRDGVAFDATGSSSLQMSVSWLDLERWRNSLDGGTPVASGSDA
jgi:hypothetical protein